MNIRVIFPSHDVTERWPLVSFVRRHAQPHRVPAPKLSIVD